MLQSFWGRFLGGGKYVLEMRELNPDLLTFVGRVI